jgi:hypothetical protein
MTTRPDDCGGNWDETCTLPGTCSYHAPRRTPGVAKTTTIACTSSVTAAPDEPLTAAAVALWIADIPSNAKLTHLTRDIGSQRDPWIQLYGLKADWTEAR